MKITHDLHIHTRLSRCAKSETAVVSNYIQNARKNGLTKIGFSDHMWDSAVPCPIPWYHTQNFPHVSALRGELSRADASDLALSFGCECEYDYAGHGIALTEDVAREFDHILVPNSHTHMVMPKEFYEPYEKHARFMLDAFWDIANSPLASYVTGIAHPFAAVACPYDERVLYPLITEKQYRECFAAAREKGIALEINISCFASLPLNELASHPALSMFEIAKDEGCRFIFGSDAHTAEAGGIQDKWATACVMAQLLNLTENDLAPAAR